VFELASALRQEWTLGPWRIPDIHMRSEAVLDKEQDCSMFVPGLCARILPVAELAQR